MEGSPEGLGGDTAQGNLSLAAASSGDSAAGRDLQVPNRLPVWEQLSGSGTYRSLNTVPVTPPRR